MADKDKLSKEVERQIQSLAKGISTQIENNVTQILCSHIRNEPEKNDITKNPTYIALETQYQESQSALLQTNRKFSEQTHQLKQDIVSLKKQLLNEKEKKHSDYETPVTDATLAEKVALLTKENTIAQQEVDQLIGENQKISEYSVNQQEEIKQYQKQLTSLETQLVSSQQEQENILSRFKINRDKQEKDNEQVRETIKYLRDENNDMINENNIEKAAFIKRINELELKLTEYRLKFEYAQKQLK